MRLTMVALVVGLVPAGLSAQQGPASPPAPGTGPGPWDNDVHLYRLWPDGSGERLAVFERAGVPNLVRLGDRRLMAAHQWFPENDPSNFDKVAVRFSEDDGASWTPARAIELVGLPEGYRTPFDPTLVPLPDGRVRLYFTTNTSRTFGPGVPWIASAVTSDGLRFEVEPGVRLAVTGVNVIDCAAALHQGVFHLYAPIPFQDGFAFHATSENGVDFVRQADVTAEGAGHWLGAVVLSGEGLRFYGTGMGGLWTATSADGASWSAAERLTVAGADPGVLEQIDGSRLLLVTGPPRSGTPSSTPPR
jgi:hypothetical protein